MTIELPQQIAEQTSQLGQPVARYRSSVVQSVLYLVCGILSALLGLGAFTFLVVGLVDPPQTGFRPIRTTVTGLLLLSAAIALIARWRSLKGTGVIAFAHGLARVRGYHCEIMRWQEIATVTRGRPPGEDTFSVTTPSRLSVVDANGREWVFTETLSGLKALRALIEERTLSHMAGKA